MQVPVPFVTLVFHFTMTFIDISFGLYVLSLIIDGHLTHYFLYLLTSAIIVVAITTIVNSPLRAEVGGRPRLVVRHFAVAFLLLFGLLYFLEAFVFLLRGAAYLGEERYRVAGRPAQVVFVSFILRERIMVRLAAAYQLKFTAVVR